MRISAAVAVCIAGLLLIGTDALTYNIDKVLLPYADEDLHDTVADHADREHKEGTCAYEAEKLCPPIQQSIGVRFDQHVRCLIPKVRQLPRHCWAAIEDLEHCVGDMAHFCDGLGTHDTAECLEHHYDQLHEDCRASMFLEHLHTKAGRDTSAYRAYYDEYKQKEKRYRDKRIPTEEL
jgi:hypothetical protein